MYPSIRVLLLVTSFLAIPGASQALGPSFAIPKSWRKPTSNISLSDRYQLATAIADTITPLFNATSGIIEPRATCMDSWIVLVSLARLDRMSNSTLYGDVVTNAVRAIFGQGLQNTLINAFGGHISGVNVDVALYGQAALEAAMAYNDSLSLTYAMDIWDQLYQYFITPEDAAGGRHPLRSSAIASTCQGSTTAGGIFFVSGTGQTDTGVNGETIGSFVTLSSYLATATGNQTYASVAELSAEFILNHLFNGAIIVDAINVADCTVSNALLSYNSGHFLDGLAEISSRNQTWVPFLNRLVSTTIPSIQWTSSDGIISEDQNAKVEQFDFSRPLKTFIIRGLFTAWSYSDPNSAMAQYIQAYTTVQYNALQDLATVPGSNVYSSAWSGPPLQRLTAWGQLSALEVMRAAYGFSLNNLDSTISPTRSTASPAPSGSPSALVSSDSPSHFSKTALLGAVIGGVALLALVVAIFLWRRHQLRQILRGGTQHLPLSRAQSNSSLRNMQPLDVTHDIQAIEPIGSSIFADPGIGCSLTRPDSQEVRESDKKRDLLLRMLFGQSRYEEEVPPSYAER